MEEYKSFCFKMPCGLYEAVKEDKQDLSYREYVIMVLEEHLKRKGKMNDSVMKMTFPISKELFMRMEEYLQKTGQSQREFLEKLIEEALREEPAAQDERPGEAVKDADGIMEEADRQEEKMTA